MCYNEHMGVHKRRDGSFYVKCDFEDCAHVVELKATDFWEATEEAKRHGFKPMKDKDGRWVSFCGEYCRMCYVNPPIIVKRVRK
mgnify:CR=1 FL=1